MEERQISRMTVIILCLAMAKIAHGTQNQSTDVTVPSTDIRPSTSGSLDITTTTNYKIPQTCTNSNDEYLSCHSVTHFPILPPSIASKITTM